MIVFEEGEYVLKVLRRHWFFILVQALGTIFFMLLPLILYGILQGLNLWSAYAGVPLDAFLLTVEPSLIVFFYALWVLIFWSRFFVFWTDYYLDAWYITNMRLIDVEQKGFFRREISSVRFKRIEDITIEIRGILRTFLDFGRINVQTAATEQEFNIQDIPHPYQIKEMLGDLVEKSTHRQDDISGNTQ